jgi:hypothetical protein
LPDGWDTDEATVTAWVNGFVETLHDNFKAGESVTLSGIGGFSTRPEEDSWIFTFHPGQRLRALFGWSPKAEAIEHVSWKIARNTSQKRSHYIEL